MSVMTMAGEGSMKAILADRYGPPESLELRDTDMPTLEAGRVLVRVSAASVNAVDWHLLRGEPFIARLDAGLRKPKNNRTGSDLAGVVESVGPDVTDVKPGDEVFGAGNGSFAEFVRARADRVVAKPANVSFEQAAAVPVAGCTALQAVRDHGRVQAGQAVLITGAGGGVGTFAVQIAKAYGAVVTATTSTDNVDLVRSIGADRVLDYTREDFTKGTDRYDVILDVAGAPSLGACRKALKPGGTLVQVGAGRGAGGPLARLAAALFRSRIRRQRIVVFLAKITQEDLLALRELMESGKVTPVIDRTYPLSQVPDAMRYVEDGHARGKVIITV